MSKEKFSLVEEYEQIDGCWGISNSKGDMIFIIDPEEVPCPVEFGERIVRLLNAETKSNSLGLSTEEKRMLDLKLKEANQDIMDGIRERKAKENLEK